MATDGAPSRTGYASSSDDESDWRQGYVFHALQAPPLPSGQPQQRATDSTDASSGARALSVFPSCVFALVARLARVAAPTVPACLAA